MMQKFKVGDFIQLTKDDRSMTDWAIGFADEGAVFEVLELRDSHYWCGHKNGKNYGIAHNHAIPVETDLVSKIKNESTKI